MSTKNPMSPSGLLTSLLLLATLFPGALRAGDEAMTLRVNDTVAPPGGRAAVVLRTYAPRGVGQGQICLSRRAALQKAAGGPFVALEEVRVFSEFGDADDPSYSFDLGTQTALVAFESLTASVNWDDGALAVLFFRVADTVAPGEEFELGLDLPATFLIDGEGQSIPLAPRSGTLTIRAPTVPYDLEAGGDRVAPGAVAALGVETRETFPIGRGQVAFLYDPAVAAGPPSVTMDPRHGESDFSVDSVPGRVLVSFSSLDGSLGVVPGQLVSIALPTAAEDSLSAVSLDPLFTYLEDPQGSRIPRRLEAGQLVVGAGDNVFADGFESGDTSRWSFGG